MGEYLVDLPNYTTEQSIAQRFLGFLRDAFGGARVGRARDIYPELEQYVSDSAIAVRGRMDARLGNLIIEFKRDLARFLGEAQDQLKRYTAALWNALGSRISFVLIASDGVLIRVYRPRTLSSGEPVEPKDIILEELDKLDLSKTDASHAWLWLDRYVMTLPERARPLEPDDFVKDFGRGSPVQKMSSSLLEDAFGKTPSITAIYDEWDRYLSYVYGVSVGSEDLFLRHTYMAFLTRLVLFSWYSGGALPSREQIIGIVSGSAFDSWGLKSFAEEDFFTWLARAPGETVVEIALTILERLKTYDLTEVKQDVLKGIYQDLVDPAERHDLGEYYTPDWLAEMIAENAINDPSCRVLDPACGSGTFLMAAIKRLREINKLPPSALLDQICSSVMGMDIHPLAVLVSRANYLLTLGDLLQFRKGEVYVPVYLANSLFFDRPRRDIHLGNGVPCYRIDEAPKVEGTQGLLVPETLADDPERLDRAIDLLSEFVSVHRDRKFKPSDLAEYFSNRSFQLKPGEQDALYETARTIAGLIKQGKNSIWAFILRNIYRPAYLQKKPFDVVIGNPPWISFRYLRNPDYQARVKTLIQETYFLAKGAHLVTHLEMAALFFVRSADLYLKNRGTIAFVMPKSVFTGDQYAVFRSGVFRDVYVKYTALWDLENVSPVFNMSASVLFGKKGLKMSLRIPGKVISGKLQGRNEPLTRVAESLTIEETSFRPVFMGKRSVWGLEGPKKPARASYYKPLFREGATLVPRSLLFVIPARHPVFGIDPRKPLVKTDPEIARFAKPPWNKESLAGAVEKAFLYLTLYTTDMLPFGFTKLRLVVLPFLVKEDKYVPMTAEEMKLKGFPGAGEWFANCEKIWEANKTERAKETNLTIYGRIDYRKGVTQQNPFAKWRVFYNSSGTHLAACVLNGYGKHETVSGEAPVVADSDTYFYETDSEQEANYLAAVLNSRIINEAVKPFQARGLWGPRHFCSKPLELPIPRFDPENKTHARLAELGKTCAERVAAFVPALLEKEPGSSASAAGRRRTAVRELLSDELAEIDGLVKRILE